MFFVNVTISSETLRLVVPVVLADSPNLITKLYQPNKLKLNLYEVKLLDSVLHKMRDM